MQINKALPSFAFVLLFLALSLVFRDALAQGTGPQPPVPQNPSAGGYTLLPPMPAPDQLPLERQLSRQEAMFLAEKIKNQQLRDLRFDLKSQDANPAIKAILPAGAELVPAEAAPACQERYVDALSQQLWHLSRQSLPAPAASQPDPWVLVSAAEGSDWTTISGITLPDIEVRLLVSRGNAEIVSAVTTSDEYGGFFFYPDYTGCQGYSWKIQAGDTVKVTARGVTSTTIVARLQAWGDGTRNVVEGVTDPGKVVKIYLNSPDQAGGCGIKSLEKRGSADAAGNFRMDFSSLVDFNGRAFFEVDIIDAGGNVTIGTFDVMHISASSADAHVFGSVKPSSLIDIRVSRDGVEIARQQVPGRFGGYFDFYFWDVDQFQMGDLITVQGGGVTLSYDFIPVSLVADPVQRMVTGKTGPGRPFDGTIQSADSSRSGAVVTTCSSVFECKSGRSNASGGFSVSWAPQYIPQAGDTVGVQVFDEMGNFTYARQGFPILHADVSDNVVRGYWGAPAEVLTATLKSSAGDVLEQGNSLIFPWDAQFISFFSQPLVADQRVEVTDGAVVREMVISDLTAIYHNSTELLSGKATGGKVIGVVDDSVGSLYTDSYCQEQPVSSNAYSLDFGYLTVGGWDYAEVFHIGPDGNITSRSAAPFYVQIDQDPGWVWVHTLQPNEPVTIEIWRGGTKIKDFSGTSSSDSAWDVDLEETLLPGDTVKVFSSLPMEQVIPEMNVQLDPALNRVYGKAPANASLEVRISRFQFFGKWQVIPYRLASIQARSGADGQFALDLKNELDFDCNPLDAGIPCQFPEMMVFVAGEHSINKGGILDSPVQADAFETGAGDNTFETAVPFTTRSQHTFHTAGDEDWIKIEVAENRVGKKHYLTTTEMGPLADTLLELYDTDGTTMIISDDDSAGYLRPMIEWTPSKAGSYYVRILPINEDSTANCGAFYTFDLYRNRLSFPLIMK